MKRLFLAIAVAVMVAVALGINVYTASAASAPLVIYVPGATSQDANNATMFANSEFRDADCTLADAATGKVICRVNEKYAGQAVRIYIAGQIFFLTTPEEIKEPAPPAPLPNPS